MQHHKTTISPVQMLQIMDHQEIVIRLPLLDCPVFEKEGAKASDAYDSSPGKEKGTFHFLIAGDQYYTDAIRCQYGEPGTWMQLECECGGVMFRRVAQIIDVDVVSDRDGIDWVLKVKGGCR
jgi:hypothetical protein